MLDFKGTPQLLKQLLVCEKAKVQPGPFCKVVVSNCLQKKGGLILCGLFLDVVPSSNWSYIVQSLYVYICGWAGGG